MIWVRRFFVLPVGAVFLVFLAFALFGSRVSATLYDPEFYKRHLAEQEVYGFVLDDLTSASIEELRGKPPDFFSILLPDNPIAALGLPTTDLVQSVNGVFPPDWVQEQLEGVIDQVVGYVNGDRDELDIRIAIHERVPAASDELKALFGSSRVHDLVLEHYAAAEVGEAFEQGVAPFGASLDQDDVVAAIDRSVPQEWLSEHVDNAIDEVAAYMSGQRDTMEIHVPLYERAEVAAEELNGLFEESDLDSTSFADVVASELESELPAIVEMLFGVSVTGAEVAEAVESGLPDQWLDEQARVVVASAAPYIVGRTDGFRANLSTTGGRDSALAAVEALVWERLEARLVGLRRCASGEQPFRARYATANELPGCSPPGIDTESLLGMLEVDVAGDVERMVGRHFPGSVEYTHADMRRGMGGEDSRSVLAMDRLRILFGDGWTYTDVDLREDWAGESSEGVEDLRSILSEGWSITLGDSDESQSGTDDGSDVTDVLDQLRSVPAGLVSVLVLAALLAAAGLLGGQSWRGRLAWASATLAVASILLFLVLVASVGPLLQTAIGEVKAEAVEELDSPTAVLGVEKALEVAQSMADEVLGGMARSSLWLFVLGSAAFGLTFLRGEVLSRFRR